MVQNIHLITQKRKSSGKAMSQTKEDKSHQIIRAYIASSQATEEDRLLKEFLRLKTSKLKIKIQDQQIKIWEANYTAAKEKLNKSKPDQSIGMLIAMLAFFAIGLSFTLIPVVFMPAAVAAGFMYTGIALLIVTALLVAKLFYDCNPCFNFEKYKQEKSKVESLFPQHIFGQKIYNLLEECHKAKQPLDLDISYYFLSYKSLRLIRNLLERNMHLSLGFIYVAPFASNAKKAKAIDAIYIEIKQIRKDSETNRMNNWFYLMILFYNSAALPSELKIHICNFLLRFFTADTQKDNNCIPEIRKNIDEKRCKIELGLGLFKKVKSLPVTSEESKEKLNELSPLNV
jgi:hypothetical protein